MEISPLAVCRRAKYCFWGGLFLEGEQAHQVFEGAIIARALVDAAVDQQPGHDRDGGLEAELLRGGKFGLDDGIVQGGGEARGVQPEGGGLLQKVGAEVVGGEGKPIGLLFDQQGAHLPEAVLLPGGFGRGGGEQAFVVGGQWEGPEDAADLVREGLRQAGQVEVEGGGGLGGEVGVFEEGDGCVRRAEGPIRGGGRWEERGFRGLGRFGGGDHHAVEGGGEGRGEVEGLGGSCGGRGGGRAGAGAEEEDEQQGEAHTVL